MENINKEKTFILHWLGGKTDIETAFHKRGYGGGAIEK